MGNSMLNSAITKCSGRGLGLFNQGDELRLFAWGEQVYGNTCGAWSGSGDFEGWQKFSYASTWDHLHGSADSVPLNC
jgi:hypothetical protein